MQVISVDPAWIKFLSLDTFTLIFKRRKRKKMRQATFVCNKCTMLIYAVEI